jgi:hypothetical protein
MRYIRYLYLNPARADLVESIGQYPGVSSWEMFTSGIRTKSCRRLNRDSIIALPTPALSVSEQKRIVSHYEVLPGSEQHFVLEPDAWTKCFAELEDVSIEALNNQLREDILTEEELLRGQRKAGGRRVRGKTALRRQSMTQEHEPEKRSKRMICICYEKALRTACIKQFKELADMAQKVYRAWIRGEVYQRIPPGMFAPPVPVLSSALSIL